MVRPLGGEERNKQVATWIFMLAVGVVLILLCVIGGWGRSSRRS
jgi:hypothetical protein